MVHVFSDPTAWLAVTRADRARGRKRRGREWHEQKKQQPGKKEFAQVMEEELKADGKRKSMVLPGMPGDDGTKPGRL